MRMPRAISRNLYAVLCVFALNVLLSYFLFEAILPPTLVRLDQSWNSGKRLRSLELAREQIREGAIRSSWRRREDQSRKESSIRPGRGATLVSREEENRPWDSTMIQMKGMGHLDSRPQSLSDRNRLHVPMLHFEMPQAEDEQQRGRRGGSREASRLGGASFESKTVAKNAGTHGGAFDFSGVVGLLWARAFYFDEHAIGVVLLRPLRAQRRQICKYRGVNANTMEFKGSMGESHGSPVDKLTVICRFSEPIKRPNPGEVMEIWDNTEVPVLLYELEKPFAWTICSPPINANVRYEWISQIMHYYVRKLSVDYFFLYTSIADMTTDSIARLGVDLAEKYASVIDISTQAEFKPYFFGQTTAMHDCLFLNRQLGTQWVLYQDLDEVLTLPDKWPDPLGFFEAHKDKSAVTFGMWSVDSRVCRPAADVEPDEEEWPLIARMKKSTRGPYCGNMCIDWRGRRKYVLQPSRVDALFIHKPIGRPLLNLPVTDGYLRNYWRVQNKDMQYCSQVDSVPQTSSAP